MRFGKVYGRFFLNTHLGITDDGKPNTCTLSELVETYQHWKGFCDQIPPGTQKNLFTMFETSDVHQDIVNEMKHFDQVWVPFEYLKRVLEKRGLKNVHALGWYKSPLVEKNITVPKKKLDKERLIFLYVGTNDVRKNVHSLVRCFTKAYGTDNHLLILKTNRPDGLPHQKNIKIITDKITENKLANLYGMCDYVVSFTRGEGVGMPFLEAAHYGKPIIATEGGVLKETKEFCKGEWITLPHRETIIDYTAVPSFLHKVFWGTWWEPIEEKAVQVFKDLV